MLPCRSVQTTLANWSPRLIQVTNGKKSDYKKPAANPKYVAIYYSAHWCPPCRAFTPKLVEWYKEFKPKHEDFELVFASSDKSEEAQFEYMKETGHAVACHEVWNQ